MVSSTVGGSSSYPGRIHPAETIARVYGFGGGADYASALGRRRKASDKTPTFKAPPFPHSFNVPKPRTSCLSSPSSAVASDPAPTFTFSGASVARENFNVSSSSKRIHSQETKTPIPLSKNSTTNDANSNSNPSASKILTHRSWILFLHPRYSMHGFRCKKKFTSIAPLQRDTLIEMGYLLLKGALCT